MFYRAALMFTFCGMLWFNATNGSKYKQTLDFHCTQYGKMRNEQTLDFLI